MAAGCSGACKQVFIKTCIKWTDLLLKTIQSTGKATKLTVKNLNNIQLIHLAELFFFFFNYI